MAEYSSLIVMKNIVLKNWFLIIVFILFSCSPQVFLERDARLALEQFVEMVSDELEEFSQKYGYVEEYFAELEKGIFEADIEIIRKARRRINLVKSDRQAIGIANHIVPSLPDLLRRRLGNKSSAYAVEFGNLWIVLLQGEKPIRKEALSSDTDIFIVLSRHTAEILMIW